MNIFSWRVLAKAYPFRFGGKKAWLPGRRPMFKELSLKIAGQAIAYPDIFNDPLNDMFFIVL